MVLPMMAEEAEEAPVPADEPETVEATTIPAQETDRQRYNRQALEERKSFMGVFDTTTSAGALGASLTVSLGFCGLVELLKFFDPNNPGDASIFGSFATIGLE